MLSQSSVNSVYSRYGLGNIQSAESFTHNGMGGASTAVIDGNVINYTNPASYAYLELTTLQIGGKGSFSQLSNSTSTARRADGQLKEIGFGFKKPGSKWGLIMGITPYSSISYNFNSSSNLNDSVMANYTYNGTGGLNRAILGVAKSFRLDKISEKKTNLQIQSVGDSIAVSLHQISIGFNANYIFGNINRSNTVDYENSQFFVTQDYHNLWARGLVFEGGILYRFNFNSKLDDSRRIKKSSSLVFGFDFMYDGSLYAEYDRLLSSRNVTTNNVLISDTSFFIDSQKGRLKIPARIGIGATWKHFDRNAGTFILSLDYKAQDWSKYELSLPSNINLDNGLKNATSFSVGMEYRPILDTKTDIFHKLQYRLGARMTNTPVYLNDQQISQKGITAGLSIPMIKSSSKLHIAAEYGVLGTTDFGLVREDYVNFSIGFTLTPSIFDRWFRQIKYD